MTSVEPHILMCAPDHFSVSYAINPWMDPTSWAREDRALAATSQQEWQGLHRTLAELGARIELVPPALGVPDLVFTANAALVCDGVALLARFRHPQRRLEEPYIEAAFRALQEQGHIEAVKTLPGEVILEGAGDCVFDTARNLFWMGHGPRTDAEARDVVAQTFGVEVIALALVDPRFYHMDTAFAPLPRGEAMYVPSAFTDTGLAAIRERVAPEHRIELDDADAAQLAANAVCIGDTIVLSACSARLRAILADHGYTVRPTPLGSFLRSGGSAFCLTLRLDRKLTTMAEAQQTAAAG